MQVELPELTEPATLIVSSEGGISDDDYFAFCRANPDLNLERSAEGAIIIVPPAGAESSYRSRDVSSQLGVWSKRNKAGKVFDSSVEFFLPNGAALSPDAAWVSNATLKRVEKSELQKFPHLCPEFVVEVMSPSDRLPKAKAKMQEWIQNGSQLAWLIDGDDRTVYIYRPGRPAEKKSEINELAGEGPVEGFVLELADLWAGL